MRVFPPCSYRKCSSAPPCLIGMNTFCFQHFQISLSCLAELTVALHLLSVNSRSDSPFLNTHTKMERTEETARKIVHERVTDLPIHCCHFSFWLKDFGWLLASVFRRGKVLDYNHPYFAWACTFWLFVAETRWFSLLLFSFAPALSARAENFSEQWLSEYMQHQKTQMFSCENQSQKQYEREQARKREAVRKSEK